MSGNTVWLASYPKSGNTWFRAAYAAWHNRGPVDLEYLSVDGAEGIASSRERFEQALGLVTSELTSSEVQRLRPLADDFADSLHDGPHLTKIHDVLFAPSDGAPIVSVAATRAAIYIVRDPRDVALSFAHHLGMDVSLVVGHMTNNGFSLGNAGAGTGGLHQLRQHLGSWSTHVTSWLDNTLFPVLPVRFEDCLRDPVATFVDAFRFAGFDVDAESMAEAVGHSSFERLAESEQAHGFTERPNGSVRFFREGKAGSWRYELDPDLAERICRDHGAVMGRLGYLDAPGPKTL
jgi:hypothetical protein